MNATAITLHNADVVWVTLRNGIPDRVFPTYEAALQECKTGEEFFPDCIYTLKPANFWVSKVGGPK